MWAAQALSVLKNTRILFSGGMGAMGFSLPCAIGACIASNQPVVVIVGDGGFQMNIQELEVIKRRNLPIKIFIFNNEKFRNGKTISRNIF
ncbi:thiamine pyrophosphate-dependent enzyme [Campylobacter coli]